MENENINEISFLDMKIIMKQLLFIVDQLLVVFR